MPRKKITQNETKSDKFERIAAGRVQNALYYIDLIGNCANKTTYNYSDEQVRKIIKALKLQINILEQKFASQKNNQKFSF